MIMESSKNGGGLFHVRKVERFVLTMHMVILFYQDGKRPGKVTKAESTEEMKPWRQIRTWNEQVIASMH